MIRYQSLSFWDKVRLKKIKVNNFKVYSEEFLEDNPQYLQREEPVSKETLNWWYDLTLKEKLNYINLISNPDSLKTIKANFSNPYIIERIYKSVKLKY